MTIRSSLWIASALCAPALAVPAAAENVAVPALTGTSVALPLDANATHKSEQEGLVKTSAPTLQAKGEPVLAQYLDEAGLAVDVPSSDASLALGAVSAETFELVAKNGAAAEMGATAVIAAAQYGAAEAGAPEKREDSYTVFLNQDAFFGFYPSFNGLIPIGENIDFSFYGILWTTPSFASTAIAGGDTSGSDLCI